MPALKRRILLMATTPMNARILCSLVSLRSIVLSASVLALWGCGSGKYQERLNATNERNAYFNRLNERLQNRWQSGMAANTYTAGLAGVALRVPKEFTLLLEPNLPKVEPDKPAPDPEPDGRQYYRDLNLALPGLLGAWTSGKDNEFRLMVLGNHDRFRFGDDSGLGKPDEFFRDLEARLQDIFKVQIPDGDTGQPGTSNVRYRKPLPTQPKFALSRSYTVIEFTPADGGVPFRAMLFELPNNRMYAAVLLLTPVDLPAKVRENLFLALETLTIAPEPPLAQDPGSSTGGTSSGGNTNL